MSRTGSAYRRSGYAKKMAAIAVALMSVAVIWTVLSEESEATGDDYTRYYYDQLDQIGKAVYDKAPMSVGLNLFHDAKMDELVNVYSKAPQSERETVYELLEPIYPTDMQRLEEIKKGKEKK